eukprot:4312337-Amphidinium_carterae.1
MSHHLAACRLATLGAQVMIREISRVDQHAGEVVSKLLADRLLTNIVMRSRYFEDGTCTTRNPPSHMCSLSTSVGFTHCCRPA